MFFQYEQQSIFPTLMINSLLVQVNKDTGKVEFPIGNALLNTLKPSRRQAHVENLQSDQKVIQDLFNNTMVPSIFHGKSDKDKEDIFKRAQDEMKTEKGRDTLSTLHAQVKNNGYDLSDKKNSYGKGIEEFNKAVERSNSLAQSAAGGISGAFEKIKESGIAAKAGAFAANALIGLATGALMQFVGWLASKGIDSIKKAATYDKDKIEKADKTRSNYQDKISDISSNISTLKGNKAEFNALSKGVDEYGNNISLDTSSYERFLSIRKEILDTTPSLISGYDAEGNAIAKTSNLIDKAIDSQEKKRENSQKKYASDETWDTLVAGNVESVKKASGTFADKFWGNDMGTLSTQMRNALQGDKTSQITKAFNDVTREMFNLGKDETLDLNKETDMNKFISSYSDILNKMSDQLPKDSSVSEALAKIGENAKDYKQRFDDVQKDVDQYNSDLSTSMPGQISGYDKLSSRTQSFLTGFASNTYSSKVISTKDLKDEQKVTARKDESVAMAKKFASDAKAQKYLDSFVKSYDKSSGKSAKTWLDNATDSYNKLAEAAQKDGINIQQMNEALADSFNVEFKFGKDGNFESLLKDGKNVTDMISDIKEKLGNTKDTQSFIDGLDLTEMSQAFDILNSKTEAFTGSLDQLKERLKIMNQTKSQSTWSDYLQAKETADSGSTYLAMREAFNAQKEERDKGLIGTDDFKTLTSVMSSSGKTDAATFDKTWAKTTKYFTSDEKGLIKFLDDLSAKSKEANTNFGTLKKNADGSWSGKLTNTTSAAKSMGMGIEAFEAVLNRLKDYGGEIKFDSVVEQYKEAEGYVNQLADKWKEMKDGAGKTVLGEQIENYRQQILKLKNANDDIPDEMVKKLKFEIEIADEKASYDTAYSRLKSANKVGDKDQIHKYQKQVNQQSFEYGSSIIDNVRTVAKDNGYYLKNENRLKEWENNQYTQLGNLREKAKTNPTEENYKALNTFLKNLSDTAANLTSGKSSLDVYEKAITSKKSLNKKLNEINPGTKINDSNKVKLTGNKEKDQQIQEKVDNYNSSKKKDDKKVTTIKVKADTKEADSKIKKTTKKESKKIDVKANTKDVDQKNKKVTKTEKKKVSYKADTKDTDKADKKQKKTISKNVKVRSDYSDAEKKILEWAGVPVDKKGRLIGDITDANKKMLEWIGIKVSKDGKLKGDITDANNQVQTWERKKVENTAILKANTSQADNTISGWLRKGITKVVNIVTKNSSDSGEKKTKAHGTANAHGVSFIPRSNAFAQGTIDDLTDWYDDEIDDLEDFDALACGTIKKLGSRALAMGTTKISDLSQIDPIVQKEKNKYIQEKKDKIKSSVGDAHANSGGDWGLKQDERALTGELGDELVV